MVEDLCFHITDLVQNAVAAGAGHIRLSLRESGEGWLHLEVADDGRGMSPEEVERAQDPFYTTKPFKKVGLGIPLLKATTQVCRGDFAIESREGQGTAIRASMEKKHIDCPPLGDLSSTLLGLLVSLCELNLEFEFTGPLGRFAISTAEVRELVGELPLSDPEVYTFLKAYLQENLEPLLSGL